MTDFAIPAGAEGILVRSDGKLEVPARPVIPFIEGDGIGPDIWRASQRVFDAAVQKAYKEDQKAYKRWARGETIPRTYVVERYYVRDYRAYDLAPPPPGYMWVRPYPQDDTYYLVQLASGLISQIFGR